MSTLAFAMDQRARHSQQSRNPFHAGHGFRGYYGSQLLRPVRLLAPLDGSDREALRPPGTFTYRLSTGSVALPVAGYNYNSDWTPCMELFLSRSFSKSDPSLVSLFDLKACSFMPTRDSGKLSRAGAVNAGRLRRSLVGLDLKVQSTAAP